MHLPLPYLPLQSLQDMANVLHHIPLQLFGRSNTQRARQQKTREQGRGKKNTLGRKEGTSPLRHSHCEVLLHEAAVAEQPSPQLHPDDAEDEEDKEAEEEDVPQHGQGVQEQIHKDAHACGGGREPERASVGWMERERKREKRRERGGKKRKRKEKLEDGGKKKKAT